jgi:hypothetical protein
MKAEFELMSESRWYAVDYKGREFSLVEQYDDNAGYTSVEIYDTDGKEVSQKIKEEIEEQFSERK